MKKLVLMFSLMSMLLMGFSVHATPQPSTLTVTQSGSFKVEIGESTAAYLDTFFFTINGVVLDTTINNKMIPGTIVNLGHVNAGDKLGGFFKVEETGNTFWHDPSLNVDLVSHIFVTNHGNGIDKGGFWVSGEDLTTSEMLGLPEAPLGDKDDISFKVLGGHGSMHVSPVPEPETYMMLLVGLGMMGLLIGKKRKEGLA